MLLRLNIDFYTDGDWSVDDPRGLAARCSLNRDGACISCTCTEDEDMERVSFALCAEGDASGCRSAAMGFLDGLACAVRAYKAWLIPDLYRLTSRPRALIEDTDRDFHYWDALPDRGNYEGTQIVLDVTYDPVPGRDIKKEDAMQEPDCASPATVPGGTVTIYESWFDDDGTFVQKTHEAKLSESRYNRDSYEFPRDPARNAGKRYLEFGKLGTVFHNRHYSLDDDPATAKGMLLSALRARIAELRRQAANIEQLVGRIEARNP